MIEIQGLRKAFNGKEVLRGIDLTIDTGETFAVIGESGCGKSVLLKHIIGLLHPDAGTVTVDGKNVHELPADFDVLASTKFCRIQIFKHRTLPVYGSQGHAEAYTEEYPDGKRILWNFAVATGVIPA